MNISAPSGSVVTETVPTLALDAVLAGFFFFLTASHVLESPGQTADWQAPQGDRDRAERERAKGNSSARKNRRTKPEQTAVLAGAE